MIKFDTLKNLILNSCSLNNNSMELFKIDYKKLEDSIQSKDKTLHVLSYSNLEDSKCPSLKDTPMLIEYVHNQKELQHIFGKNSSFITFMIYSLANVNGTLEGITTADESFIKSDELFVKANGITSSQVACTSKMCSYTDPSEAVALSREIVTKLPVYSILVFRSYVKSQDKFEYFTYFRSNYEMLNYWNFLNPDASKKNK